MASTSRSISPGSTISPAAFAPADSRLFLNNDVIIAQPDWLRVMIDEALADPAVAMVVAKLVSPNGTVQHGSVVLGVGSVADHAFKGIAAANPGYMSHTVSADRTGLAMDFAIARHTRLDGYRRRRLRESREILVASPPEVAVRGSSARARRQPVHALARKPAGQPAGRDCHAESLGYEPGGSRQSNFLNGGSDQAESP